jgi:hypothetical protein
MGSAYNENVHQVVELCCELLTLVHNACMAESLDGGSILAYARISECASRMQVTAEKRRRVLAEIRWEDEIGKGALLLNSARQVSMGTEPLCQF